MPKSKAPRKAYRPRWLKVNPLELVADRIRPVELQGSWLVDRRLKQSAALAALMQGTAVHAHISDLMAMHNMAVAMQKFKSGGEYHDVTTRSREAVLSLITRSKELGRYVATGPEINALKELYELHDAQLNIATVGQVNQAYEYARRVGASGGATRLPKGYLSDQECA